MKEKSQQRPKKKLTLKKETVRTVTVSELAVVVGGEIPTAPEADCETDPLQP